MCRTNAVRSKIAVGTLSFAVREMNIEGHWVHALAVASFPKFHKRRRAGCQPLLLANQGDRPSAVVPPRAIEREAPQLPAALRGVTFTGIVIDE